MKIGPEEVRHVATLAEIAVPDDDLAALAGQLEAIVNFVAQLDELADTAGLDAMVVGPERAALRADLVDPIPMARGPAEFAPVFEQGFFVVPRLGHLADD